MSKEIGMLCVNERTTFVTVSKFCGPVKKGIQRTRVQLTFPEPCDYITLDEGNVINLIEMLKRAFNNA